jgi:hypothetical protein
MTVRSPAETTMEFEFATARNMRLGALVMARGEFCVEVIEPGECVAFVLLRGCLQITRQRAGEPASYCLHATPRAPSSSSILAPTPSSPSAPRSACAASVAAPEGMHMSGQTGFNYEVMLSRLHGGLCAFQSLRAHRRQREQAAAPAPTPEPRARPSRA